LLDPSWSWSVDTDAFVPGVEIVPYPSTLVLLATGRLIFLAYAWRRRRR
jgi:hypothetical protein